MGHPLRFLVRCSFGGPQLSERRAAGAAVFPIDAGDLLGRNAIFGPVAPREGEEGREEGAYESGRAIARQLDVRIGRLVREHVLPERALLGLPIGVALFDLWQYREVE